MIFAGDNPAGSEFVTIWFGQCESRMELIGLSFRALLSHELCIQ